MSLISRWYATTLAFGTDNQNTPEVNLQDSFEAIEIDIPTIEAAEIQIKGSNESAGTFDLIGQEEPVPSTTGGFRTTVPLGGKYQYIKVYLSAAQTADRIFAVRGISYASAGLVALIDRIKNMRVDVGDIEVNTADIEDGIDELKVITEYIQKAEDAAHTSGDKGVMALGIRKDKHEAVAGTDGDYTPEQTDKYGGVRLAEWGIGPIELRADNSGWAVWEKKARNAKEVLGTDLNRQFRQGPWAIHMNGGPQAGGEDWVSVQIPINEMKLTDLDEIMYTYYKFLAGTEHLGRRAPNIVISVHNPADHDQRADINTRADNSGAVTEGWHETILAATGTPGDLMYWWGDITPTPDTVPTQGTNYTWAQYQADSVFSTYTVYRIQIDYGYWAVTESAGDVWIGSIQINNIPVKMIPTDLNDLGTRKNLTGSPIAGEASLYSARNSSACWARGSAASVYQKSPTMWAANLYGGDQTNDDWASVVIPVNELPVSLLHKIDWTYFLTNAEVGGVNVVIWVHDPFDFSKRAEITQLLGKVGKSAGFNVEKLDPSETELFYYGENVANTSITPTAGTQYTWAQFQGDECFNTWTIYRITLDYGWNGPAPVFDDAWVTEITVNDEQVLLKPDSGGTGRIARRYASVTSGDLSLTIAPKTPWRLLTVDFHASAVLDTAELFTATKDAGLGDLFDTVILSEDLFIGSRTSYFATFGEGYDFDPEDEVDFFQTNGSDDDIGLVVRYQTVFN